MRAKLTAGIASAAIAAAALVGVGCGGGSTDQGVATITPQNAWFYVDANLRPQGDRKKNLNSFLSAVLGTNDPGQKITELIDRRFKAGGHNLTFSRDVSPWLGNTAGAFVIGNPRAKHPPSLVAVKATNTGRALAVIRSDSKGASDRSYKGVSYQVDQGGTAFGSIKDFIAFGNESALKAAIDGSKSQTLAGSSQFRSAVAKVPSDSLGRLYIDLKYLIGQSAGTLPSSTAQNLASKFGLSDSLVVSASAASKSLALDIHGLGGFAGKPPALLGALPADATFAVAIGDVGGQLRSALSKLESLGIPGLSRDTLALALQSKYGIDLQGDLLSWVGDAAIFTRGTSPGKIDGALVVKSTNDAAAARALDKLRGVFQGKGRSPGPLKLTGGGNGFTLKVRSFPQPLNFVQANGLFVIGVGQAATRDALKPGKTLSSAKPFGSATGILGSNGPAFYASVPALVALIESSSKGRKTASFAQAKPYLDRLSYLTGGQTKDAFRVLLGAK